LVEAGEDSAEEYAVSAWKAIGGGGSIGRSKRNNIESVSQQKRDGSKHINTRRAATKMAVQKRRGEERWN
jgi:hypothetical protein